MQMLGSQYKKSVLRKNKGSNPTTSTYNVK